MALSGLSSRLGAKGNRFRFVRYNPNTHTQTHTRNMDPTKREKAENKPTKTQLHTRVFTFERLLFNC